MSSTLPLFSLSSSDNLANELTDDKISKYLTHWLTSPTPYVHQLSGIKGIKRLCGGIEELCTRSKPIIIKYIQYFHRICVVSDFDKIGKIDIMVVAMGMNGHYKAPKQYVFV